MMLELAIGDAYGAGFEYVRDRKFITKNTTSIPTSNIQGMPINLADTLAMLK